MSGRSRGSIRSNRESERSLANRYAHEFEEQNYLVDATKQHTMRIVNGVTAMMGALGDYADVTKPNKCERIAETSKKFAQRLPNGDYATTLMCVHEVHLRLGHNQRRLHKMVHENVVVPLNNWLKQECNEFYRLRELLLKRRSELDAAKAKLERSTRNSSRDTTDGTGETRDQQRSRRVAEAQTAHDAQKQILDTQLAKLSDFHEHHRQCVRTLHKLMRDYYADAVKITTSYIQQCKK